MLIVRARLGDMSHGKQGRSKGQEFINVPMKLIVPMKLKLNAPL